jgi:PKD repeat protein
MRHLIVIFIGAIWLLAPSVVRSQTDRYVERNTDLLHQRALDWEENFSRKKLDAIRYARIHDIPVRQETPDGRVRELQYISDDGLPVYYETKNAFAAMTSSARQLHPGGRLRLHLTGKGFKVGVWDGGFIFEHNEFAGRVTMGDGSSGSNRHATHVTGTIIAAGLQPAAKGMAYEAEVLGYDWNNDLAEIASAAANGILISNHSYGYTLGWGRDDGEWRWYAHPDSTQDYRFGFYSNLSRSLDEIAFNAPYISMVWAAGNDRSDVGDGTKPPDGPYDTIGPESVAKNVLAVGAVRKIPFGYSAPSNVQMSSFSSWGPVDDGRVKPDFVAAGVDLYSTVSNNAYAIFSGTSMSAPNATGSLLLLHQLYASRNDGMPMRAATLKSLVIQTVHQAGNSKGPDYANGWGLLNVEGAANLINNRNETDFIISELILQEGETYSFAFESDGTGSIVATIAWTDPPGTPVAPAMNPRDKMLVNDLDIRIYDAEGKAFLPWKLNPDLPSSLPERGDNSVDNVEKILVEQPAAGMYRLEVSHKGQLANGKQDFALCLQSRDVPVRKTFYWVGGSGSWHAGGHWSLSSGGSVVDDIPGLADHVVFDSKSFTDSIPYTLNLEGMAQCYSLSWETAADVRLVFNDFDLVISTSLYATGEKLSSDGAGNIRFSGRERISVVDVPETFGQGLRFVFDNEEGHWTLLSDLTAESIELISGGVDMQGKHIRVSRFIASSAFEKQLILNNATFDGLSHMVFDEKLRLEAENARYIFVGQGENPDVGFLSGGGNTLYEVINQAGQLHLAANDTFKRLQNQAIMHVDADVVVDSLFLDPGSLLTLGSGVHLNIVSGMLATGSPGNYIGIAALNDGPAWFTSNNSLKICADFLYIVNVSVYGTAIFNAGLNSTFEGDADGWLRQDCDQILFADFNAQFTCVNSVVFFEDKSSGNPTQWEWSFDLDDSNNPRSDWQHAFYIYPDTGYYRVGLRVSDGEREYVSEKQIYIKPNTLSQPEIFRQDNRYTSIFSALQYQWFLNGRPIPGATARLYDNIDEVPGEYQVMTGNRTCNRISEPLVTSSEDLAVSDAEVLLIYPNPAKSYIHVNAPSHHKPITMIQIIDLYGKVISSQPYESHADRAIRIDTHTLSPGMYFLRVHYADGVARTNSFLIQ